MTDPLNRALVSARATSPSPKGLTFYARSLEGRVGVPLSFDVQEPSLTGVECLLGAVASDVLLGFRRLARLRRVPLDELEATLKAEVVNTLSYLGVVGESGPPHIESLDVKVYAGSSAPEERVRGVWDEALVLAPILNTLRAGTRVTIDLTVSS